MRTWLFHLCLGIAWPIAWASHSLASESGFDGFWIFAGTRGMFDVSNSKVNYDYTDLHAGSLSPPGFQMSSSYKLTGSAKSWIPIMGIGYITAPRNLFYGFRISAERFKGSSLSSDAFDFAVPYAGWNHPQGFSMVTVLEPSFDLSFSFEPGLQTSEFSLTYLRLSYHRMRAQITTRSSIQGGGLINPVFTEASSVHDLSGLGVGLGTKFLVMGGLFLDVAFDYVSFLSKRIPASSMTSTSDEVTLTQTQLISPRWVSFSVLLGYSFE